MKRARLGEAEQERDLSDRQRRVGDHLQREAAAKIAQDRRKRRVLALTAAPQGREDIVLHHPEWFVADAWPVSP